MRFSGNEGCEFIGCRFLLLHKNLICKEDYIVSDYDYYAGVVFLKNCKYEVMSYNYNMSIKNGISIRVGDRVNFYWFNFVDIFDYFYSESELRKLKLERLRNV